MHWMKLQKGMNRPVYQLSGWPSGLRRQTQGYTLRRKAVSSVLVHECGRGFKSHFWQNFFDIIFLNTILQIVCYIACNFSVADRVGRNWQYTNI